MKKLVNRMSLELINFKKVDILNYRLLLGSFLRLGGKSFKAFLDVELSSKNIIEPLHLKRMLYI